MKIAAADANETKGKKNLREGAKGGCGESWGRKEKKKINSSLGRSCARCEIKREEFSERKT